MKGQNHSVAVNAIDAGLQECRRQMNYRRHCRWALL